MAQVTGAVRVPAWDVADRMRKALRESGLGVQDMAEYLGVSRNTVSTWINGRISPSAQTLRLWAMRCDVPYEWLRHGISESRPDGGPGGVAEYRCSQPRPRTLPARPIQDARRSVDVQAA